MESSRVGMFWKSKGNKRRRRLGAVPPEVNLLPSRHNRFRVPQSSSQCLSRLIETPEVPCSSPSKTPLIEAMDITAKANGFHAEVVTEVMSQTADSVEEIPGNGLDAAISPTGKPTDVDVLIIGAVSIFRVIGQGLMEYVGCHRALPG